MSKMIRKIVPSLLAFALVGFAQKSQAQTNLLPVTFNAICTSTNTNGLVKEMVRGINLIDDCAVEHGLTNLDGLRLVFNPTNFTVLVVSTNGSNLCTSLSFPGGTTFTNTSTNSTLTSSNTTTQIVFQRDVLVETNLTSTGLISGTASWKGTNMSAFKLNAILLFTEPASGTNSTEICRAVLNTGGHQEDNDGDEGHGDEGNGGHGPGGDNGKHLGQQNPNNPHSH
jgi:hypothetical protein